MRQLIILLLMMVSYAAWAQDSTACGPHVVRKAKQYIGVPYRAGQMSPKRGFDCSGFTTFVFRSFSINLSRSSRSQFCEGERVDDTRQLRAGDLVFFTGSRHTTQVGHVGIVTEVDEGTGEFSFIHATPRKGICISKSTEAYYNRRYLGARRVIS